MTETFVPKTKNFNIRKPVMVIIHGISTPLDRARDILSGRTEWEASAHYLITQTGEVDHYVEHTARSWHAGAAYWAGFEDINSISLGIELQGSEELADTDENFAIVHYSNTQIDKLCEVLQKVCAENKIAPYHILGHQDIVPYRKKRPRPKFRLGETCGKRFWPLARIEKNR